MGNICDVYKEPNDIKTKLKVFLIYLEAMANFDSF